MNEMVVPMNEMFSGADTLRRLMSSKRPRRATAFVEDL